MLLSVETVEVRERFGEESAFEIIKNAGFDGIDFSFYGYKKQPNPLLEDNYLEVAKKYRKKLDSIGLVCNQAHAPFALKYDTPKDDPLYTELYRSLEFAALLGVKNIIVHTVTLPDGATAEEFVNFNLDLYRSLVPYCERLGIKIGVENLFKKDKKHNRIVGKLGLPDEMNAFMSQLDSRYFTVCVDIGHASLTDEPDAYIRGLDKGILGALHVQDTDYLSDKHTIPYLGIIDWEAVTSALADTDYRGDFSLEVFRFFRQYPDDFLPTALGFAAQTGRYLVSKIEKYKKADD